MVLLLAQSSQVVAIKLDKIIKIIISKSVAEVLEGDTDYVVDILACNLGVEHSCRTCAGLLVASLSIG